MVYGGENEHREYLSDVIIFDITTATWTQPDINGPAPRGRARHSAVIHDEKLWISGGQSPEYLSDICFLDLKTWSWSRVWKFVPRLDHILWVWNGRIWAFGGLNEEHEHCSDLWWIDFRGTPSIIQHVSNSREGRSNWKSGSHSQAVQVYNQGAHAANSASVQSALSNSRGGPGSVSMLKFVSSTNFSPQSHGHHFHMYSSGYLLDFATPATVTSSESSLCALDLETLRWFKLAEGRDLFNPNYRWHYCAMNDDGTQTWLLGCPPESSAPRTDLHEELLSDVLHIDLVKLGIIGNKLHSEMARSSGVGPTSDTVEKSPLSAIGADLARMFDRAPETGSGTDFIVTAAGDDNMILDDSEMSDATPAAKPIHVHKLILQARWPHFARLYSAQMLEFHTKKLSLPEPYTTVRAFLYYLYTDSITANEASVSEAGPALADVAGLLVMSNLYDMPRLRGLCVDRLGKELDIEHAATIWERAALAGEDWLRRRAARYCMTNWGRVVRTEAFRSLQQSSIVELCEETDEEGRVLGGAELETVASFGGARGATVGGITSVRRRVGNSNAGVIVTMTEDEGDDDEPEMDIA